MKRSSSRLAIVLALPLVATVSGCTFLSGKPKLEFKESFHSPEEARKHQSTPTQGPAILLIADNQKASISSEPIIEQGQGSEQLLNTAHRRAALDALSLDIVEHIYSSTKPAMIIHAGDILNSSCSSEFDAVKRRLDASGAPWFVAPGNHDGYYLGISSPRAISKIFIPLIKNSVLDERGGWAQTCTNITDKKPGKGFGFENIGHYGEYQKNVVDKAYFNALYLEAIGIYPEKDNKGFEFSSTTTKTSDYEEYAIRCAQPISGQSLRASNISKICWTQAMNNPDGFNEFFPEKALINNYEDQFEEKYPWKNFVVQKVKTDINGKQLDVLIIDTSSYSRNAVFKDSGIQKITRLEGAAGTAHISKEQWGVIQEMIGKDDNLVVVGHHPLGDFDNESILRMGELFESGKVVRYVSGDTHDGYDGVFTLKARDGKRIQMVESNMGSTIDAPLEYATLGIGEDGSFVIKRSSLTPLTSKKDAQKLKRSGSPKVEKNYAVFDESIWRDACGHNGWEYAKGGVTSDPLGSGSSLSVLSRYRIRGAGDYGFLPYVQFWNLRNVYFMDKYDYKINRMIDLVEVYRKLYAITEAPLTPAILQAQDLAERDVSHLVESNFRAFFDVKEERFHQALKSVVRLVGEYESTLPQGKIATDFKLCSALFEAEREYRGGGF